MKTKFNPEQKEAIQHDHHRDGPLLLLAGPGSGKTAVLTERIAYLLAQGESAKKVIALTFTRAAAREMRERLAFRCEEMEQSNSSDVYFGTFHALALFILRREGLRSEEDPGLETLLKDCVAVLSESKERAIRWCLNWSVFLVDELQDIDPEQLQLLKILAGGSKQVFAVGDDDQAIYGFRGAVPGVMKNFSQIFPGSKVIKLERNYRSNAAVLRVANRVFRNKEKIFRKVLYCASERKDPLFQSRRCTQVRRCARPADELRFILRKIREIRSIHGLDWNDFALLLRTNRMVEYWQSALELARVPVEREGKSGVRVMTIHASKGLQFPIVFCPSLARGLFPAEDCIGDPKALDEERRLFYVAITRAESALYLSFSRKMSWGGRCRKFLESPFLRYGNSRFPFFWFHCFKRNRQRGESKSLFRFRCLQCCVEKLLLLGI